MMRNTTGILCSIAFAVLGACAWGDGSTGPNPPGDDDPATETCGDGTCAATEVGVCAADCGNSGSNPNPGNPGSGSNPTVSCGNFTCEANLNENSTTCPADCGAGSGGGGSGTLDCNDQATQFACIACLLGAGCTGVSEADCMTCGGLGGGGGGGLGNCEGGMPDGNCNAAAGEDATTCPFDCM